MTTDASGLHGRYYPASHSLIRGDALAPLVQDDFGLTALNGVHLIQSGLNDHYTLRSDRGDRIVRVYRAGWRSNQDVLWELELLEHLAGEGAPVAAGMRRLDGSWFSEITAIEGVRQVAVFERAPGPYMHFGNYGRHRVSPAQHAEQFGRSMAEIHAAADRFHSTLPRLQLNLDFLIEGPLSAIAQVYAYRAHEVHALEQLIDLYRRLLQRADISSLEWGPIHGDITGGNSTYWHGQVIHFDFDFAGPGWRAYDLGTFFWSMSINGHGVELWDRFWEGYSSRRPLPRQDLSLVRAFAGIRELWLLGLRCVMAPVLGSHNLHDDYFDRSVQRISDFYTAAAP